MRGKIVHGVIVLSIPAAIREQEGEFLRKGEGRFGTVKGVK